MTRPRIHACEEAAWDARMFNFADFAETNDQGR
jgi:hypothetical protein